MFQLKYLGVTMVEQPKGEELSAAAVKRIVATVRDKALTSVIFRDIFSVAPCAILKSESASYFFPVCDPTDPSVKSNHLAAPFVPRGAG